MLDFLSHDVIFLQDVFLIASIEKGIVVVSMTTTGRTTSQRTIETSYSDGKFHNLMVRSNSAKRVHAMQGNSLSITL